MDKLKKISNALINGKAEFYHIEQAITFACAIILMMVYLLPRTNMTDCAYDAADIWKTITTWYSSEPYGSYVLYKGILAIYPFVWLYKLAVIMNLNEWFWIKIYYIISFAYIVSVGFPRLFEKTFNKKACLLNRIIFVFLCFFLWYPNFALTQLMIDLPSLMYFLLLINCSVKSDDLTWKDYIWMGILTGINLCSSGQYTAPTICVWVFYLVKHIRDKHKIAKFFFPAAIGSLIKGVNVYFLKSTVANLIESGAWIPSGGDWLSAGYARFMNIYKAGGGSITIYTTRNTAIFQSYLGDQFTEMQDAMLHGGYPMTIGQYLKLVAHYPIDFILCYLNRFFLCLSPDGDHFCFIRLFLFYSMIFLCLYTAIKKWETSNKKISAEWWIPIAFLWALVPVIILNVELRLCMQVQGYIMMIGLFSINWKDVFEKVRIPTKQTCKMIIIYMFFMIVFFMHIGTLYELSGNNAAQILIGI